MIILLLLQIPAGLFSQPFAPPAGQPGTTAIPQDSPFITAWANSCRVIRGPAIIINPDSLVVTNGEPADATGHAGEGRTVSLGDGGSAILYFTDPLPTGPGPDFAVFENAFSDDFLELAFVEVSSDSVNFFRFDAISLTPADVQVGTYGSLNAVNIHNLAGKYRVGYGTPFDLNELGLPAGLNLADIHWIRIIDVIGIIDEQIGNKDSEGNIINDPWPTPFNSGGFDLDAVCGLSGILSAREYQAAGYCRIVNNLFDSYLGVDAGMNNPFSIIDIYGRIRMEGRINEGYNMIDTRQLPSGVYILIIKDLISQRIVKLNYQY
jgi:hypothetical protein